MIYTRVISSAHRAMSNASDGLDDEQSLSITHLTHQKNVFICWVKQIHRLTMEKIQLLFVF